MRRWRWRQWWRCSSCFLLWLPPEAAHYLVQRLSQLHRAPPSPAHSPKILRRETQLEMRSVIYCKTCAFNWIQLNSIDDDDEEEQCHLLQDLCIQLNLWQRVQTGKYLFIKELKNRCRTKNCELCNDLHSCKFLFPLRLSSQHDCDIFLRYELEKRLRSVNSETYFVNNPY